MVARHRNDIGAAAEHGRHRTAPVRVLDVFEKGVGVHRLAQRRGDGCLPGDGIAGPFGRHDGTAVAVDHVAVEKQELCALRGNTLLNFGPSGRVLHVFLILGQHRAGEAGCPALGRRAAIGEEGGRIRLLRVLAIVADGGEAEHHRIVRLCTGNVAGAERTQCADGHHGNETATARGPQAAIDFQSRLPSRQDY
jgi:hypothetical protein